MLRAAFPKLSTDWFKVLLAQAADAGFTNERFTAAVNELIRTCEYPEPTIARILNFDRKITLLDYRGYCEKCAEGMGKFWLLVRKQTDFLPALWARTEDCERYGIEPIGGRRD